MRYVTIAAMLALPVFVVISIQNTYRPQPGVFDPSHPQSALNLDTAKEARAAFARGIEMRSDAAKARPEFEAAAKGFDVLWSRGFHTPALALYRSRAHRLAGDLPGAILALREGLAAAPYDRDLHADLADARRAIVYPAGSELEAMCAPRSPRGWSLPPWETVILLSLFWAVAFFGPVRYFMTRSSVWIAPSLVGLMLFLALLGLGWKPGQNVKPTPVAVVTEEVLLRTGNGTSYSPRLEATLPRGVEVKVLGERGGWLHVELAGGAFGWLPADAVIR